MLAFAACDRWREPEPPVHDFLLSAGDSTFWVQGGDDVPIHVRGSPLLLARIEGRFYELYVADDDRSYYDAVLIGQRLYRRDLLSGDSLLVYEDSVIPTLARAWARANPGSRPLEPTEESSDDPAEYASAELEILDLHGPYLSYEYHRDRETRFGDQWHLTRWGVLDIRRGGAVTLAELYGDGAASQLVSEGRRRFTATVDSMLAVGGSDQRTLEAIAGLSFDPRSFTIVQLGRESAVAFLVPSEEARAGGMTLELDPIPAGAPAWWKELRDELPEPTDDALVDRWGRPGYDVIARYDEPTDVVRLSMLAENRQWPIASVPPPVQRIEWLDAPPIDSMTRQALRRAFDEAVLYDPSVRIVRGGTLDLLPARLASTAHWPADAPTRRGSASRHRRPSTTTALR